MSVVGKLGGHKIESWYRQYLYYCFKQPPCCYFTLYKNFCITVTHFSEICYPVPFYGPIVSGHSANLTSQVRPTAVLLLPTVEN
jgi:hypothetical protein